MGALKVSSMKELDGLVALVTGGSRGIGLAISQELGRAGARVAVVGRNREAAESAATSLEGAGHEGYGCDVSDAESTQAVVAKVEEDLGPVEILVNNAGITRDNIFIRMKEEEWDEVLAVNLKGAFNMTRALARGMMKRRSGVVLNMTSVVGIVGNAGQANYAASKAGLIGFTKSIAKELAPRGIRCNAIAPGFITTDMTEALPESMVEELQTLIPLGRFGDPGDVSGLVRFLAGPAARYITGQVVAVDGGMAI
jgi:3-oxoacyl-[acyl-carrier protein] reductase